VGNRFVRPYFDVEGDGPLCEEGEEWKKNGHLDDDSEFIKRDTCWDLANGDTVIVDVWWMSTHEDSGDVENVLWLLHPITSYQCDLPFITDPHDTIVDTYVPNQVWQTTDTFFTIPSTAECVRFGLFQPEGGGGELNMSIWLFTKLDEPTNLSSSFNGDSVTLNWTNAEPAQSILDRSPGDTTWLGVGVATYGDHDWDYGTTHTYKVRHRSKPTERDARLSDWSSSTQVTIPDSLTAYISGLDTIPPDEECAWTAVGEQGTSPYSYSWSGDVQGTSQVVTESFEFQRDPYVLALVVTDSLGWQAFDTLLVVVDRGLEGQECELK